MRRLSLFLGLILPGGWAGLSLELLYSARSLSFSYSRLLVSLRLMVWTIRPPPLQRAPDPLPTFAYRLAYASTPAEIMVRLLMSCVTVTSVAVTPGDSEAAGV
ncbi:hypothetical protein B0H12DRAFT_1162811 [Mycena haematopus]|nr:hypothetical protein B0H12DRAFT_1162811 [Mycena haematopus]